MTASPCTKFIVRPREQPDITEDNKVLRGSWVVNKSWTSSSGSFTSYFRSRIEFFRLFSECFLKREKKVFKLRNRLFTEGSVQSGLEIKIDHLKMTQTRTPYFLSLWGLSWKYFNEAVRTSQGCPHFASRIHTTHTHLLRPTIFQFMTYVNDVEVHLTALLKYNMLCWTCSAHH